MTAPLPLPDDRRTVTLTEDWLAGLYANERWPRSRWLHDFEAILREHYPASSSKQRTLTARLAAPFPLAKPGIP